MASIYFDISRFHTSHGIFKGRGYWQLNNPQSMLEFSELFMMGTDGWFEVTHMLKEQGFSNIWPSLEQELKHHLQSKNINSQ